LILVRSNALLILAAFALLAVPVTAAEPNSESNTESRAVTPPETPPQTPMETPTGIPSNIPSGLSKGVSTEKKPTISKNASGSCLVDEVALEDIKKAKDANDAKAKELSAREAELKIKEQVLNEQLGKLQSARNEMNQMQDVKKAENQQKVQQLTDTILIMSPKAAAKVLSKMDEKLAVDIMTHMDNLRLAKIMNLMDPANSTRLSEHMAGIQLTKGVEAHGESNVTKKRTGIGS